MKYKTKCPFCKKLKDSVEWHIGNNIVCYDCQKKYLKKLLDNVKPPAVIGVGKKENEKKE